MDDAAAPPLSYTEWTAESTRISELAQRVSKDDRLAPLLAAVTSRTKTPPVARTAAEAPALATSSSFFSKLFSSGPAAPQPTLPWCASLAQLLALAELPAFSSGPTSLNGPATPSAHASRAATAFSPSSSSSSSVHRRFAQVVAAIASSGDRDNSNSNSGTAYAHLYADRGDGAADAPSLVSSSHALFPMRASSATSSPAARGGSTLNTTSFDAQVGDRSRRASDSTRPHTSFYDDRDEEDDGGFDRMFARLKQQAAQRSQHPSPPNQPTTSAAKPPAASAVTALPAYAGLTAAREALDAADVLLLRVQQQNRFSPAPSGRIAEAQTLLVRATVSREAQLYTSNLLEVVETLLQQHDRAQQDQQRSNGNRTASTGVKRAVRGESAPWAASVAADSATPLRRLLYKDLTMSIAAQQGFSTSSTSASPLMYPPQASNRSLDYRIGRSPQRRSNNGGGSSTGSGGGAVGFLNAEVSSSRSASPFNASARALGSGSPTNVSPTSASSISFYHAPHSPTTPSTYTHSASRLLPAEVVAGLRQWTQLVTAQQRALRCAEVHDYATAGHLFLGAAAERAQFDSSSNVAPTSTEPRALVDTPAADLAAHGVTHLLRACGLLLSDPFLEQEVVYPVHLLREVDAMLAKTVVTTAAAATATTESSGEEAEVVTDVVPPSLRAAPHAARVWMLLAQLATFLERHRLSLPWDTKGLPTQTSVTPSPPVAHRTASAPTLQMLWEVATAVLLLQPTEALRTVHAAAAHTTRHLTTASSSTPTSPSTTAAPPGVATSSVNVSLHELFQTYTCGSSTPPSPQRLVVQPGTVPLCLLSLRRACAAAVRARHYAEALRDVEVALYVLTSPTSSASEDAVGTATNTKNGVVTVDYRRVTYWPADVATSAATTCVRTSACLSTLAHLDAKVFFLLMRVLLLLLETPLTAGSAAAELIKQGELVNHHAPQVSGTEAGNDALHLSASPRVRRSFSVKDAAVDKGSAVTESSVEPGGDPGEEVSRPLPPQPTAAHPEVAAGQKKTVPVALRPPDGATVSKPVAEVEAVLRQTLHTLHTMTAQMRLLEQEGWMVQNGGPAEGNTKPAAMAAMKSRAAVSLASAAPVPEHRLSAVLRRTAAEEEEDGSSPGEPSTSTTVRSDSDDGDAKITPPGREDVLLQPVTSAASPARRRCALTSTAHYAQLRRMYQQPQRPPAKRNDALVDGDDTSPSARGIALPTPPIRVTVDATPVVSDDVLSGPQDSQTDERDADGDDSEATEVSSVVMDELQRLLGELLAIVCFLTLPLRAPSTCTVTRETAVPLGRTSTHHDDVLHEENGYDKSYAQARGALRGFAARLERCLRRLGARDRTLFALLRRLQAELLFPAVCGPPL